MALNHANKVSEEKKTVSIEFPNLDNMISKKTVLKDIFPVYTNTDTFPSLTDVVYQTISQFVVSKVPVTV